MGLAFAASPCAPAYEPKELGEALWAWGWAGKQGEQLTLEDGPKGKVIRRMADLSGRGNHFLSEGGSKPGYEPGLDLGPDTKGGAYKTRLPVVGLDRYRNGAQVYGNVFHWERPLEAKAGFYLAAACLNTRDGGVRELFGADARNFVRLDQERDQVEICIAGERRTLCAKEACPKGLLILEVWRTDDGVLGCRANGKEISTPGVKLPGTLALSGLGFDGEGSSQWDDYWMEFVLCDRLPPAGNRDACGDYLRAKWKSEG
jgi:hypothetical protein